MIPVKDLTFLHLSDLSDPGLVLPCGSYATGHFLILWHEGKLLAVSLDEVLDFEIVDCSEADQWHGAFIKDVEIRVDPTSFYSTEGTFPYKGSLVVRRGVLTIAAKPKGPFRAHRPILLPIGAIGSINHTIESTGIASWQIGKIIDGEFVQLHLVKAKPAEG